jgi:hypothetical protein
MDLGQEKVSQNEGQSTNDSPDFDRDGRNEIAQNFGLERYKYILQQIHTVNENVYRFLAIYQTLATVLVSLVLALFVGYREWGIDASVARAGVVGLMILVNVIAAFTVLLIFVGVLTWFDFRREECDLTNAIVYPGFRKRPQVRNLLRWYETYVISFIVVTIGILWILVSALILPGMQ